MAMFALLTVNVYIECLKMGEFTLERKCTLLALSLLALFSKEQGIIALVNIFCPYLQPIISPHITWLNERANFSTKCWEVQASVISDIVRNNINPKSSARYRFLVSLLSHLGPTAKKISQKRFYFLPSDKCIMQFERLQNACKVLAISVANNPFRH